MKTKKLIDISQLINNNPVKRKLYRLIEQPCEQFLRIDSINAAYSKLHYLLQDRNFFSAWLEHYNIHLDLNSDDIKKIPASGPLVIVSNHPFGALDGLALGSLLTRIRSDVKILGNYILLHIPELRNFIIPVDPFNTKSSTRRNISPLKEAIRWLKKGGVLITFPAGEVSHFILQKKMITDPPWTPHIASIIRRTKAIILPVFFFGSNSTLFHLLGLIHPRFRTVLLIRELINKKKATIKIQIGSQIPFHRVAHFRTDEQMIGFLRLNTFILKNRGSHQRRYGTNVAALSCKRTYRKPLIAAGPRSLLQKELESLPAQQTLLKQGDYAVYLSRAEQIPTVLNEICRLREKTFRDIGEGTGKAIDKDFFDNHYLHLFMWDHTTREIVGGYRIGQTDKIIQRYGRQGLYVTTLFNFKKGFLENLSPALELGRSFISSHYQKKYNSLYLLWRGIFTFIVHNPQYCLLYGPVSISNDYQRVSKNLMIKFLLDNRRDAVLSRYVKPKNPVPNSKMQELEECPVPSGIMTCEHVSTLISAIEKDHKGMPVLLRQYLKLNGTIISFNLDKKFCHAIDGLLLVNLKKTDTKLLKRFMGTEGFATFSQYNSRTKPFWPISQNAHLGLDRYVNFSFPTT